MISLTAKVGVAPDAEVFHFFADAVPRVGEHLFREDGFDLCVYIVQDVIWKFSDKIPESETFPWWKADLARRAKIILTVGKV